MASTYTNIGIEKPGTGEQAGTWGTTTNTNFDIIDRIGAVGDITLSGTTHTLTATDGAASEAQFTLLNLGGTPSGTNTITISPNDLKKFYIVYNNSGQTATFTQGSGSNVSVSNGASAIIFCDGGGASAAVTDVSNVLAVPTDLVNDTSPQLGGTLESNGNNISFADNDKAVFGTGNDFEVFHNGSNAILQNTGTGEIYIGASGTQIWDETFGEACAKFFSDSDVELYYDGNKKFETSSTGVSVTGSVTASSDLRLKENVERITDAVSKVNELEGVTFDWKDGSGASAGVIAQQVMAVMPSSVDASDADHLRVNYDSLIGLLIEAIKEQGKRIEALEQG